MLMSYLSNESCALVIGARFVPLVIRIVNGSLESLELVPTMCLIG